jgi:hypothetical protein
MIEEEMPDFVAMTADEMDHWIEAEEAKMPFTSFDLTTDAGRQGLLEKYYRIGDTALFEAVSHIWTSLNEPRAEYCTLIGMAAKTGGKGKRGLVLALQRFLHEALESINWIPPRHDFLSREDWHEATIRTFRDDAENIRVLLERYSTIMNCGVGVIDSSLSTATIIQGPWGHSPGSAQEQSIEGI